MGYQKTKKRRQEQQNGIRQRKAKREAKTMHRTSVFLVSCTVCLLFIVLLISSYNLHKKNLTYQEQIKEIQEIIAEEEDRSEELDELEEYVGTDEYVEDVAREKLGLVYPNEIIFEAK